MKDVDGNGHGHRKGEHEHHRGGHRGRGRHNGAQTFRRGRALDFLGNLNVKRTTLKQQLDQSDFQAIRPVILGELKAIELVIEEFSRHFELHEKEDILSENAVPTDEKVEKPEE